jgi:hypothetical protein
MGWAAFWAIFFRKTHLVTRAAGKNNFYVSN